MKNPLTITAKSIESSDIAFYIPHRARRTSRQMCSANNYGVTGDEWGRMQTSFTSYQINILIEILLQVYDAIGTKISQAAT